ncbi:uncharacterized protein Z518_01185 [Rhinocladiella mackenziei CBS 650.93]|uniref:Proteophosphoglycan 5 n=1 Tax=Rhinocladiella mackenziei CBS 650.93 TaxID=1442369 RepID=A0A0D2IVP1_9EURO|nr:uncharacterized protein Z518_01185 [Rhinocladiella mackenziei CBS 650.93]KIX10104.1 hypothetical protein Z518_01185 [Rhinocladiella mackenziei CBS 650.93]
MSTPTTATTPHQQSSKGPRRLGKKHRPTDNLEGTVSGRGAPPDHQPNPSPAAGKVTKNNNKGQPRKASHANSKSQSGGFTSDHAKHGSNHHEKAKATPMKPAAYAGSTFQQSPAASALPLPSFYSKSLPTTNSLPSQLANGETVNPQTTSVTPAEESPSKRESTPCDFLFEAARQARTTPRTDSPATRSGNLSVPNGSPASRSPAPREGDPMFPFELEGGSIPGEDGSSFATPYKDRIEALRSARSTSGGKSMDENERKAKSDALKKLLMKSSGQEGDQGPGASVDMNNPFNARAPHQQDFVTQEPSLKRHSSGPSTPVYMQDYPGYNAPPGSSQMAQRFPPPQMQTPKRPISSRLRNVYGAQSEPEYAELSSDSGVTPPISTARSQTPQHAPQYGSGPIGQPYGGQPQMPTHRSKPSAQQLEDDLRRVLKLDLTSRG